MRRPQLRIRSLLILVLIAGIAMGFEAWRRRQPMMAAFDDPADQAYVERYFELRPAQAPRSK